MKIKFLGCLTLLMATMMFTSCGGEEPTTPKKDNEIVEPINPDNNQGQNQEGDNQGNNQGQNQDENQNNGQTDEDQISALKKAARTKLN